jgi:AmmeMemoRadiSam system protein B
VTRNSFETPFGVCDCDRDFVDGLLTRAGIHFTADEICHRMEHSIEFQVVFLQHVVENPRIAAILCGGLHTPDEVPARPEETSGVTDFIAALRESLEATDKRICVVVSVDFTHMGGRFGDQTPMTPQFLGRIEREDLETLSYAEQLDADGFYESATADGDRRHIDATPAVYVLLKAMDLKEARLLKYDQSVEPDTQSVVTFASMVFR